MKSANPMDNIFKYILTFLILAYPVSSMELYGNYEYYTGPRNNLDMSQMMRLINNLRETKGENSLSFDVRLACAAKKQCRMMAALGEVEHDLGYGEPWDRMEECGFEWRAARENLYYDNYGGDTQVAHKAWVKSDGHYKNLIAGDVDRIGIAVCNSGRDTYWVQAFGKEKISTGSKYLVQLDVAPVKSTAKVTETKAIRPKKLCKKKKGNA